MYRRGAFQVFAEQKLRDFLNQRLARLKKEVTGETDDHILNVSETEYTNYLVNEYYLEPVELDFDQIEASTYETDVPAEHFPGGGFTFNVERGHSYRKDLVRYHIPYAGTEKLLRLRPSRHIVWTTEVTISEGCLCFDIVNFRNDSESIKRDADSIVSRLKQQLANVNQEVATYNASLEEKARTIFKQRKEHLLHKHDLMASLGVPLRKRDDLPGTFSIPTPKTRKRIRVKKPSVTEVGYRPEPALDDSTYREILEVLHNWGKQLERMPSTYIGKDEEALRDLFLAFLEPRFVGGSATGETFNKAGKTDLLLRYESSNVFIAECKFWHGPKAYGEALSQLFGYLTWRDSKAAILLFVSNKAFSPVLAKVEEGTPEHPNYLGTGDKIDETWLNYRFHLDGDPNREVKVAILAFHFPETDAP